MSCNCRRRCRCRHRRCLDIICTDEGLQHEPISTLSNHGTVLRFGDDRTKAVRLSQVEFSVRINPQTLLDQTLHSLSLSEVYFHATAYILPSRKGTSSISTLFTRLLIKMQRRRRRNSPCGRNRNRPEELEGFLENAFACDDSARWCLLVRGNLIRCHF